MHNAKNKTELFNFLADKITSTDTAQPVIVTKEQLALSNHAINLDYSQEETYMRMFVHVRHAIQEGNKALMIKANDTDDVIIAVATMSSLQALELHKLWVAFRQSSNLRWIPIHKIVSAICPEKTNSMLFSHSFSDCDIVSAFQSIVKAQLSV